MKYSIEFSPTALKQLKQMPTRDSKKIVAKIETLETDPRPHGYKKLVFYSDYFRIRVGNYRIIYQIDDPLLIVSIAEVSDRRDAY